MNETAAPGEGLQTRAIDSLRDHPQQSQFFDLPTDLEIDELSEDICRQGLLVPP